MKLTKNCKHEAQYTRIIDLSKIDTIEQCRDMIIILAQCVSSSNETPYLHVTNKAIIELPSLRDLTVD